jgi:lysophospholipid acyltransferase (LPLAT)-like uncharacterized protein
MKVHLRPYALAVKVAAVMAEIALRAWHKSLRKDIDEIERLDSLIAGATPILAVFWHGKYLPLFVLAEGRQAKIVVGESFRGEVIKKISHRFGFDVQMIPASHDGRSSGLVREIFQTATLGALAPDGPLGPYHTVRIGAVSLASELGLLVVPLSVASKPKLVMSWRWDWRELPMPFAKVSLSVGDPIRVPPVSEDRELALWAATIRRAMEDTDKAAEMRLRREFV